MLCICLANISLRLSSNKRSKKVAAEDKGKSTDKHDISVAYITLTHHTVTRRSRRIVAKWNESQCFAHAKHMRFHSIDSSVIWDFVWFEMFLNSCLAYAHSWAEINEKEKKIRFRLDYFKFLRTVRIMHCLLIFTFCNCLSHHAVTTYSTNNSLRTTSHRLFQIYSWLWKSFFFAMLRSVIIAINIFDQRFLQRQLKLKSHLL